MLTFVPGQVNSIAMVDVQSDQYSSQTAQQVLTAKLLQPLLERRRPQRVLILQHDALGQLQLEPIGLIQIIYLSTKAAADNAVLQCRLSALPFTSESFDLIVLQHLVTDGDEDVLREALRVLAPGGDVLISGLNSAGVQYRIRNRQARYPGLRINRIIEHLKSESFVIEHCLRMGLAGLSGPPPRDSWHGMSMPFADHVVLHGHHQSHIGNASILRFKQTRRSRVNTAALDGVSSRKAAS